MAEVFSGITIEGLDKLMIHIKQTTAALQQDIDFAIAAASEDIANEAAASAPANDAVLRRSITADRIGPLDYEVKAGASYAAYVEFGTGGKVKIPTGWSAYASQFQGKSEGTWEDMIKSLMEWVRKKGLSGTYSVKTQRRTGKKSERENEDFDVAFAIMLSILRHGIKPQPFLFPAFEKHKAKLIQDIKEILANGRSI